MSNKKTLGLVLVIAGFVLLALTGIRTISSPDIFTHIALGQAHSVKADPLAYTMAGAHWINLNPLYNSFAALLWSMGKAPLVTLVHVLIVLASFVLMFNLAKTWGGPLSQALALLLCSQLILPVFNPGPGAFFMLFTALFLTLLYRVKNFALLAALLLVLQVLWTNIHPSFLFGPALILFFAIENWQESGKAAKRSASVQPLTGKLAGLAVAALAVTLINPNTVNLHRHVLANVMTMMGRENLEWISLFSGFFSQTSFNTLTRFTLLLGAAGLVTLQKKLPSTITMLALTGAVLSVISPGMSHLFAFLAFPFMILSFSAVSDYLSRTLTLVLKTGNETQHRVMSGIALLLILLSAGALITNRAYADTGSASSFGLGVEEAAFPVAAAGVLSRPDFPKNIVNIAHDGGYIAMQAPGRKVFCDTRSSFYGTDFYKQLDRALLGQPAAWNTIMDKNKPQAVVMNGCWPDAGALAGRLIDSKAWKLVYFDGATVILVRNMPEYAALIKDSAIQKQGLRVLENDRRNYLKQNQGLVKAGNPSRLIGAAGVYLALNRVREAEAVYTLLSENNPRLASAWLGLGQCLILQRQITKGTGCMEKARDIIPDSSRVWMSLLHAYRLKGDEANARRAVDQLNKFFKAEKATVEEQALKDQKKTAEKPAEKPVLKSSEMNLELPPELK